MKTHITVADVPKEEEAQTADDDASHNAQRTIVENATTHFRLMREVRESATNTPNNGGQRESATNTPNNRVQPRTFQWREMNPIANIPGLESDL